MANYRDPKVTTPTTQKRGGGMGRWIGIILAVIVVVLLIAWWWGGGTGEDTEVVPAVTGEPVTEGEPVQGDVTLPAVPADPAAPATPTTPTAPAQQ